MSQTTNPKTLMVRILIIRENESWIAQGLEYDITGHGSTLEDVIENFGRTLVGQILVDTKHGQAPLANIPKAPKFYWEKFEEALQLAERKQFSLPKEVPPAFMIDAADLRIYA